jgi:glycosyltransferase involved in cell wall biosynthesis
MTFTRDEHPSGVLDGVNLERWHPSVFIGNSPVDFSFAGKIRKKIHEVSPDLVVAHTPVPFPAEMAYLAARRAKVPFVVTYHAGRLQGSSLPLDAVAWLDRHTLERRMLKRAHGLIAVSHFVRDHAFHGQGDRAWIVPPGVDPDRFSPAGTRVPNRILFVGPLSRAYRWKGIDVLWRAFQLLRRQIPATLAIVGGGDRFPRFAEKARQYPGEVELLGRVPEERLIDEYRKASVVVLPSVTDAESFGMVLAEANACGRPVVGSRIGGIPNFVREGDNGLLAIPRDPFSLANKLLTVLSDEDLARRMGERGRERVVREHDWEKLATTTERAFEAALRWKGNRARQMTAAPVAQGPSTLAPLQTT